MGVTVREKQAGSGEYWVFVYNNGQQTSRKIGDKKLANQIAVKLEKQLAEKHVGLFPGEKECPTFKEYAEMWLETQAKAII
jgi:integrase